MVSKKLLKKTTKSKSHSKDSMIKVMVRQCVDNEGFDYTFRNYSDFSQVKNKEFHLLRKAYIKAADALEKFIDN